MGVGPRGAAPLQWSTLSQTWWPGPGPVPLRACMGFTRPPPLSVKSDARGRTLSGKPLPPSSCLRHGTSSWLPSPETPYRWCWKTVVRFRAGQERMPVRLLVAG